MRPMLHWRKSKSQLKTSVALPSVTDGGKGIAIGLLVTGRNTGCSYLEYYTSCGEGPCSQQALDRHSPFPERVETDNTRTGPRSSQGQDQGHGQQRLRGEGCKALSALVSALRVLLLAYFHRSTAFFLPFFLCTAENAVVVFKIVWNLFYSSMHSLLVVLSLHDSVSFKIDD